jgi:uncharacterized RDD family membrane protein YckC
MTISANKPAYSNASKITGSYQIETAEGIDIDIVPAGVGVRTYAFFLDFLIRIAIYIVAAIILTWLGDFGQGLFLIILFFIEWFYPVVFEIYKGATPGKSVFKLRVVYDNGLPITFAGSLTRNLFRFVDILPAAYAFGAVSISLNKQNKRLGDIIAGTTVIYQNTESKNINFEFEKDLQTNILSMTTEQQQLVIAFAQRSKLLSKQRQIELANLLSPMLKLEGTDAVEKLKAMAAVLVGKA